MFKMIKQNKLILVLLMAVFAVGGTLMVVSQGVYEKETSVSSKGRQLVEQEWELRTLKAEWAYLSRPDRIDELSSAMGTSGNAVIVAMQPRYDGKDADPIENLVTPVTMSVPTPTNKPFYMIRPAATQISTAPSVISKSSDSAPKPKSSNSGDFSSLLKTIGGTP
jgi:hypothetical protein